MSIPRPTLARPVLIILAGLYMLAFLNSSFWTKATVMFHGYPFAFAAFGIGLSGLFLASLLLFSSPFVTKLLLVFFIFVAASASYFTDNLGTVITPDIIIDSLTTTHNESRALLTPSLIQHLVLYGVLPSIAVCLFRIKALPFFKLLQLNLKYAGVLLLIAAVALLSNSASIISAVRADRTIDTIFNPLSPLVSAVRGVNAHYFTKPVVVAKLGTDAKPGLWLAAQTKPNLTVIVIGETARAQNFSLFGYDRNTNPELAKRSDLVLFPDTSSCGTLTADSLPCMFSNLTRAGFSRANAAASENLLNVLNYAGIRPKWLEANTGSKGVAALLGETMLGVGDDPRFCRQNECNDGVLVEKLKQLMPTITKNSVIVLHQIGSHGPAYFMRYPESFKPFGPDCRSSDFKKCSREEIINAYDNTIAFTDKTLAEIIDVLVGADSTMSSTMIYVSDHGESLGELGLYLHGVPYFMAPKEQTHVPFITWASPSYLASRGTTVDCLRGKSGEPASHDNFFHTVLGVTGVTTSVYRPEMDVFSQCWATVVN
jgi:lipid A ethanolaminephosphotransferase